MHPTPLKHWSIKSENGRKSISPLHQMILWRQETDLSLLTEYSSMGNENRSVLLIVVT